MEARRAERPSETRSQCGAMKVGNVKHHSEVRLHPVWAVLSTRLHALAGMHRAPSPVRPNPSIEGTSTIRLRLLAAAPHVKR